MPTLISNLKYRLAKLYWSLFRPLTVGIRILLIQEETVLLVKHQAHGLWYLPGGGVEKGESLLEAIRREAMEEIGASIQNLQLFGVYSNFYEGKSDHIIVFQSQSFTFAFQPNAEVAEVGFFDLDTLPETISPGTQRRINEYLRMKETISDDTNSSLGLW